ncbi:23S rRNA (pseudouridine(1915)-N(3))-methyltransferase RlmH [Desulfosoma caldarium]|uniref:Ribosomal RNA large subunit methyltransferase H n=1 Tax=Desulfosoma caldarium TaxID=610254 RepID=A0A3N1UHR7_9BACT|nr:23S rRNA (pseudouridine(1915)-N(3))-methyltransferase RlmH [Desulfosoma caldarium]ROQ90804.1 23S rRNA (pseudouridine1915-N3)-methyltransferase [Desulfosoma caldarium]
MKIHFVFVGKTVFPEMQRGIDRYLKRLDHYVRVEVHVVRAERVGPKADEKMVLEKEGRRIVNLVSGRGVLIVWDEKGTALTSQEYAHVLQRLHHGGHDVWMILGGPLGLSHEVKRTAHHVFSLSAMTFPHDLARLMVAEQTYRALTILRGEPYHKS